MLDLEYEKIDMLSGGSGSTIDVNSVNKKIGVVELDNVDVGSPSVKQFIDLTEAGIKTANDLKELAIIQKDYTDNMTGAVGDRLSAHEIKYSTDERYGHVKVDGKTLVSRNGIISVNSDSPIPAVIDSNSYLKIDEYTRLYPITSFSKINTSNSDPINWVIIDLGMVAQEDTEYRFTIKGMLTANEDTLVEIDVTFTKDHNEQISGSWRNETNNNVGAISVGTSLKGNTALIIGRWDINWSRSTMWLENVLVTSNHNPLQGDMFKGSEIFLGQILDNLPSTRLKQDVYFDDNPKYVIGIVNFQNHIDIRLENSIYGRVSYHSNFGIQFGLSSRKDTEQTVAFRQQVFEVDGTINFQSGDNLALPYPGYADLPLMIGPKTYSTVLLTDNTSKAMYRITIMPTETQGENLVYLTAEMLTDYTEV